MSLKEKLKGKKLLIVFMLWILLLIVIGNKMFEADPVLFDDRHNLNHNTQYTR